MPDGLDALCEALARGGNVWDVLVNKLLPPGPQENVQYAQILANVSLFAFRLASRDGWDGDAGKFKITISLEASAPFTVELAPVYASPEALRQHTMRTGRDYAEYLPRLRHMLGIVCQMLVTRFDLLADMLRGLDGKLPAAYSFFVTMEDGTAEADVATLSRPKGNGNLLLPDPYYFVSNGYASHKRYVAVQGKGWAARRDQAVWRGSTTGARLTLDSLFKNPRIALADFCRNDPDLFDVKLSALVQARPEQEAAIRDILAARGLLGGWMDMRAFADYKFALHIDGNASAAGFFEKLCLGCCVLRVDSVFEQWFEPRIKAWTHYVPVEADFADLRDKLTFLIRNPILAERVARAGFDFAADADPYHEAGVFVVHLAQAMQKRIDDPARIAGGQSQVPVEDLRLCAPEAAAGRHDSSYLAAWHGLERHGSIPPFRWTSTERVSWELNLPAGMARKVKVSIPFLFGVTGEFPGGCELQVNGSAYRLQVEDGALVAEIALAKMEAVREITLVTPPLHRPADVHGGGDTRRLGLAIPVV